MSERPKSFKLYTDLYYDIKHMSKQELGEFFMAILNFVNGNDYSVCDKNKELLQKVIDGIEYEWSKYNPKTGKYHHNYKGGITPENKLIRSSERMKWWSFSVLKRDEYTCQGCGIRGGELHAHHIKEFAKYKELRFELSNGLTLCKVCHRKIHSKKNG